MGGFVVGLIEGLYYFGVDRGGETVSLLWIWSLSYPSWNENRTHDVKDKPYWILIPVGNGNWYFARTYTTVIVILLGFLSSGYLCKINMHLAVTMIKMVMVLVMMMMMMIVWLWWWYFDDYVLMMRRTIMMTTIMITMMMIMMTTMMTSNLWDELN